MGDVNMGRVVASMLENFIKKEVQDWCDANDANQVRPRALADVEPASLVDLAGLDSGSGVARAVTPPLAKRPRRAPSAIQASALDKVC